MSSSDQAPESQHSNNSICIVVPTHNRIGLAAPVFTALKQELAVDGNTEVVVVDQHSNDGVDAMAAECGFTVIRSNAATAGGLRNEGVAASQSHWVVFIDSDVLISHGYLMRLRSRLTTNKDAIIGCNYGLPQSTTWTERNWHALTYTSGTGERRWLNAGNMALSRKLFMELGGFNGSLSSGEDTDLCSRAIDRGARVLQFEDVTAAHLGNPKSIVSFFQKQLWHGQGAHIGNRNSLAAIAHMGLVIIGLYFSFRSTKSPLLTIAIVLVLTQIIPTAAYFVAIKNKSILPNPFQSIANLHAYFFARFMALVYRSGVQR
ncbi:MAG: glycosyltransferase [Gemmatimonadaceae bacterium]|nr:glycosyltransferase [Gemmatimonadaceae bacterium]